MTAHPAAFPRLCRRWTALALPALLVLAATLPLRAAPWPAVESDLPQDPAVRTGRLENGLRYAIRPHDFPAGRVALRLVVAVGSREEREDERGMAHFLEHMAFRGTRNYPRGALIPALERLGVAHGPDNTAFTYYDHTEYILELPDAQPAALRQALGVFRDFADGITFDADLIDLERAVILNEKSIRNTPQTREQEANRIFLWPNAREAFRSPIGLADTVARFTRDQFIAFHDAWYRPERMAVVVVGDVAPDAAEAMVREAFESLRARGPARPEPTALVVPAASERRVEIYREESISGAGVVLEHPFPDPRRPDTAEHRREALHRALAFSMFGTRLRELAQQESGVIASPHVSVDGMVEDWAVASFTASGRVDRWRPLLAAMEQELRRAHTHGFTPEELRQAVAGYRAFYEQLVRTAGTRESAALASSLKDALLRGRAFSPPEALRDAIRPVLDAVTVADCLAAFRRAWGDGPPRIFIGAHASFGDDAAEAARVLAESARVAVAPPVEKAAVAFAYTGFGPPGALRRDQEVAELGIRLAEFGNRVRLNFKPTDFDRGFVSVSVRVGSGRLALPMRGLDYFAGSAFLPGGLGRHPSADLASVFAGRDVTVRFGVLDDAFILSARTSREDLLLGLQVIAAYLSDPAFRPEGLRDVAADIATLFSNLANAPGGQIGGQLEFLLSGGDERFGVPDSSLILQRTPAELAAWLGPQLRSGPVEISVVGDTTWDRVVTAVAPTLGALPEREPRAPASNRVVRFIPGGVARSFTSSPTLRQANVTIVFPVPDAVDVSAERRCVMLAEVLDERIRIVLREELGATYTPSVRFVQNEGFEGLDYFLFSADVLAAHLDRVAPVILREVEAARRNGIGPDLFSRVRETVLRQRAADLRENGYWLFAALDGIQQYPGKLEAVRNRAADYAAITAEDLNAVARRYLVPAESFLFTAVPAAAR